MYGMRLSTRDLWMFSETLAAIIASGCPLAGAVESLARDVSAGRLRRALLKLSLALREGQSFSAALSAQPGAFPATFIAAVEAGERTDQLKPVVEQLAEHYSASHETRQRLSSALLYPLVLTVALLAVFGMVLSILPAFDLMYHEMEIELPSMTRTALFLGRHSAGALLTVVAAGAGALCLLASAYRVWPVRVGFEWVVLRTPILGPFLRTTALRHLCQTTGMLMTAGEPLSTSLGHAAASSPSVLFAAAIRRLCSIVEQGGHVSDGMERRRLFPRHFVWLISTAERRGDLPETLCAVADSLHRTSGRHLSLLITLASPAYLIFILVPLIGFVVTAMLAPLVRLMVSIGA